MTEPELRQNIAEKTPVLIEEPKLPQKRPGGEKHDEPAL